jgi:cyclophilin family peptidyl-prolyl cis-trans isomerase/HEAT repeat protein
MGSKLKKLGVGLFAGLFVVFGYYLYDTLRPRTFEEKQAEIIHFEDRRQYTSRLADYLEDPSPQLRARAALAVGRIGDSKGCSLLFERLVDSSLDVAATAAFAIGLNGDDDWVGPLMDMAWETPARVAAAAVKSAGRLADSTTAGAAEGIAAFLEHPSPDVREAACYALFYSRSRQKMADLVALLDDEPDSQVRLAALFTLARLREGGAAGVFKQYLADPDPFARSLAVRGLADSDDPEATQLLSMALNDRDLKVVAETITSLSRRDHDPVVPGRLAARLRHETDEMLTVALLEALRRLESDQAVGDTYDLLTDEPSDNVLAAALRYLGTVLRDGAVAMIDSVLNEPQSARVRVAATEAYAATGHAGVVSRLGVRFGDEDPLVRAAAFAALIEADSANTDYYLDKALNDADWMPAVYALDLIGRNRRHDYLPVIATIMSRGDEVNVDLRRVILDAIEPFIVADSAHKGDSTYKADSTAMDILMAGLLDRNYIVRRRAAEIYREAGGKDRSDLIPPAGVRFDAGYIEDGLKRYRTNPQAVIVTNRGNIIIELYFDLAPLTVLNFVDYSRSGFYDGLPFHRVVPNFVIQGGDPRGDGWGGPEHFIRCEYSDQPYLRGTVGIATSGKDTGGSQFFITHSPQPHLEARYTIFGQVLDGMEVVDAIVPGDVIQKVLIQEQAS